MKKSNIFNNELKQKMKREYTPKLFSDDSNRRGQSNKETGR